MTKENTDDHRLDGARTELQKAIVKSIMDDERNKPVVVELDGGAGVFATHKITFHGHELFARSEEDAKFAKDAIMTLNLVGAANFAFDLTGAGGERPAH